jgi:formyl-CoA transferase
MDAKAMFDNPDYANAEARSKNRAKLNAELSTYTKKFTSAALIDKLSKASVPCGPIYDIGEMFSDPQVQHVKMATPLKHPSRGDVNVVNQAMSLSRTPSVVDRPTAEQGAHTDEILEGLGYDQAKIADFRARKVV